MNTNRVISALLLVFVCIILIAVKAWAMNTNPTDVEFHSVLNVAMIGSIIAGIYNVTKIGDKPAMKQLNP